MKKLTLLFYIYLRKLFQEDYTKMTEYKPRFLNENLIDNLTEGTPRAGIKNPNSIEAFYVSGLLLFYHR